MKYLLVAVLLWAVIATVGGKCARQQNQDYEARAQRAESQVQNWVNLANTDSLRSVEALKAADSLRRANRALRTIVQFVQDSLNRQADSLLPLSPNICEPLAELVEKYRGVVSQQEQVIVGLTEASRQDSVALDRKTAETKWLRLALDSASAVLHDRPKPRKWLGLIPRPLLYVGYGIQSSQGRIQTGPQVGVGLQIKW